MRTLGEIIEAAKDGDVTTHEECLYGLLAMCALSYFNSASLRRLLEYPNSPVITVRGEVEESFRREKAAYAKSPKEWVGWKNDPANLDYQQFRTLGKKLIDKIEAKALPAPPREEGQ